MEAALLRQNVEGDVAEEERIKHAAAAPRTRLRAVAAAPHASSEAFNESERLLGPDV